MDDTLKGLQGQVKDLEAEKAKFAKENSELVDKIRSAEDQIVVSMQTKDRDIKVMERTLKDVQSRLESEMAKAKDAAELERLQLLDNLKAKENELDAATRKHGIELARKVAEQDERLQSLQSEVKACPPFSFCRKAYTHTLSCLLLTEVRSFIASEVNG